MNLKAIKKVASFLTIGVWIALIFKIFLSGGSMQEQLPKCIFTTMITFGILNAIIKYIEYLEKRKN